MKIRIAISFLLIPACLGLVSAQNAAEDIKKMNLAWANAEQISIEITYKVFASEEDNAPVETEYGKFVRKDGIQYNKLAHLETLSAGNEVLSLDHENKVIYLFDGNNGANNSQLTDMIANIDKVVQQCEKIDFKEVDRYTGRYILYPQVSEFKKVIIDFDRDKFYPGKMELYYSEAVRLADGDAATPKLELIFDNIKTKSISDQNMTIGAFLVKRDGKYVPVDRYSNFEIQDLRANKTF